MYAEYCTSLSDISASKLIKCHASIHLLYFTMAFALSEQIKTASKTYLKDFGISYMIQLPDVDKSVWV